MKFNFILLLSTLLKHIVYNCEHQSVLIIMFMKEQRYTPGLIASNINNPMHSQL